MDPRSVGIPSLTNLYHTTPPINASRNPTSHTRTSHRAIISQPPPTQHTFFSSTKKTGEILCNLSHQDMKDLAWSTQGSLAPLPPNQYPVIIRPTRPPTTKNPRPPDSSFPIQYTYLHGTQLDKKESPAPPDRPPSLRHLVSPRPHNTPWVYPGRLPTRRDKRRSRPLAAPGQRPPQIGNTRRPRSPSSPVS